MIDLKKGPESAICFQLCHETAVWPWVDQFPLPQNQNGTVWSPAAMLCFPALAPSWLFPTFNDPEEIFLCLFSKNQCTCQRPCYSVFSFPINYASLRTFTISHPFIVERKFALKWWPEFPQCFLFKNISLEQDSLEAAFLVQSGLWTNYGTG